MIADLNTLVLIILEFNNRSNIVIFKQANCRIIEDDLTCTRRKFFKKYCIYLDIPKICLRTGF